MSAQITKSDGRNERSKSQAPRNGLAKQLLEADPDTSNDEISKLASERTRFECPECGWTAELQRSHCWVCQYDEALNPIEVSD